MQVHRYQIKPLSAFATPLRSDTLYGQLLCASAELDGESGVKALIKQFSEQQPPFILSSAFPAGQLPTPVLPGIKRATFKKLAQDEMFELLSEHKKFRKQTFMATTDWDKLAGQMSSLKLFQYYQENDRSENRDFDQKNTTVTARTLHNTINRNTSRVIEGGLYSEEAHYFKPGFSYDIYVKTAQRENFERLLRHVAATGFGADASTGKGQFEFELDETFDNTIFDYKGNAQMNLSVCMAHETDQFTGTWNLFTKLGKVWNGFGESNPFKKPFIAFTEGSVFTQMADSNHVLRNIHSNPDYVQIGLPLTLPLTLEESR